MANVGRRRDRPLGCTLTISSWVDVPDVTDDRGRLRQARGITPSPGLYTLGRIWQHTRGSALIGWVGNDAAFLAERIAARGPMSGRPP